MVFFDYVQVAQLFSNTSWVVFLIGGLCFALVYVFQAIALYIISGREGYGNRWMAFVPFLNTYYIGVCAQKNKFYNIDTKKIGITAAVFEFVLVALNILFYAACALVIAYEVPIVTTNTLGMEVTTYRLENVPENLAWAAWIYDYLQEYILSVMDILYLLLSVCLLICFFQTYACRRYVLFTLACIFFPIVQGILFFVVCNNKGVNYKDYIRALQARNYQMYQQQFRQQNYNQNPYNNPYNQNYNRNPYEGQQSSYSGADDPFGDLGESGNNGNYGNSSGQGGSPFDDFDNN